jgi:rod shape-determining protein MreD
MTDFTDRILIDHPRKSRISKFRPAALILIPLAAILFQVYVPLFFQYLAYLELPLLVTVYFSLMRRQPVAGTLIGTAIGLAQDSLSHQPLGMFGLVKTLVGYFSSSVSLRFDVDNAAIRLVLAFFFYVFHQFFYWMLVRALLGQPLVFDPPQTLLLGLLNSAVAIPLFHVLDKLKEKS